MNMTDDLKNIPEKYRDCTKEIILPKEGERPGNDVPPPNPTGATHSKEAGFQAGTGMLGRDG
ncbi:MAG: hypothetical protein MPW14_25900 (plasmid) [Candidatus Manganitrophus sp.]|nr:hypothetical protein [Candidatus Manganitrophus sp.]WDT82972.1 MAG: hypothetical protein MPW14_25900 [Candidatus Manganitrophus sp.]